MNLYPSLQQTLVSAFTKDEVLKKMAAKTQLVDDEFILENPEFNGTITKDGFRISSVIRTAQNALPLAIGKVENTSMGSIIFLQMKLFPAAVLYLKFFTLLCFLIAMVFLLLSKLMLAGLVALLVALANYTILTLNFHQKAHQLIRQIELILEEDME